MKIFSSSLLAASAFALVACASGNGVTPIADLYYGDSYTIEGKVMKGNMVQDATGSVAVDLRHAKTDGKHATLRNGETVRVTGYLTAGREFDAFNVMHLDAPAAKKSAK